MDSSNVQTASIGYFSSSVISFLHFEDIILAILLGFFGALGAWLFKYLMNKIDK
jgi:hypothetical protein